MAIRSARTMDTDTVERRHGLAGALAGLALAAAVAAGIGVWQTRGQAVDRPVAEVTPAAARAVAPVTRGEQAASYLYLLDSDEGATFVRRWGAELNDLRARLGQPPIGTATWVTAAPDREALAGLPLAPGTRVIDLRGP